MTPHPTEREYETFYRLNSDVQTTKAEWEAWNERLATANRRDRAWSTADWKTFYKVKAEYEAALGILAAFCSRTEAAA